MRITAYHGTDANFNRFDFDKIGSVNGTDSGFGFYFTTSKGEAVMYGNNVMTVELNLKKKISNKRVTLSVPVITKLLTNLKISIMITSRIMTVTFEMLFQPSEITTILIRKSSEI